jgi:DNA helicase HerA-like ATPase
VDSIEEYLIWRSKGDGETDIRKSIPGSDDAPRILVVDLQSLSSEEERYSIVNSILAALWARGRKEQWEAIRDIGSPDPRVPTFIVVDEAHNIIPDEKPSNALQQLSAMFVRTAAEGRKYGLHLIVVTQRPRKIDASILTECDNLFLMKMTNDSDLEFASQVLGFLSKPTARKSKALSVGDLILAGSIGSDSNILHVSPRRTLQGGRGIPTNWTSP